MARTIPLSCGYVSVPKIKRTIKIKSTIKILAKNNQNNKSTHEFAYHQSIQFEWDHMFLHIWSISVPSISRPFETVKFATFSIVNREQMPNVLCTLCSTTLTHRSIEPIHLSRWHFTPLHKQLRHSLPNKSHVHTTTLTNLFSFLRCLRFELDFFPEEITFFRQCQRFSFVYQFVLHVSIRDKFLIRLQRKIINLSIAVTF